MYNLSHNIADVIYFFASNQHLLHWSNKLFLDSLEFLIPNEEVIGGFMDENGLLNVTTKTKIYWYKDYGQKLILVTDHFTGLMNFQIDETIKLARTETFNYSYFDTNSGNHLEVFNAKFNGNYPSAFYNKFLFFHKFPNSTIQALSLLSGEYEWEVYLNSFGEIRKLLGVIEEKLWVVLYRGGENQDITKLIALDIHTGDIIIELPESLPLHNTHISIIEEKQTILSIWGMKSSHHKANSPLVEIDGKTGRIIRNHRIESLFEANLKMGLWKYLDDKIFFVGAMDYINSTHVGVLDYNTLDLLWYEEVAGRKAGLKEIQVTGDKIFCLDIGHQLHIYEKVEEDKS